GLKGDRQWMIVNEKGQMVTQRKNPKLALIQPRLYPDGRMELTHTNLPSLIVEPILPGSNALTVYAWKDSVEANAANKNVSKWLRQALDTRQTLRLVQFNPNTIRTPGQPERFGATARHFADAAPYLICNAESLRALNRHLRSREITPVSMTNFRGNIIIDGLEAFSEHRFSVLATHRGKLLQLVDHCSRCIMITVDPLTGEKRTDSSPLMQLAELNSMPTQPKAPAFGINASLLSESETRIQCGDRLTLS
ncbi:MAG: hypothetical protein ACI93R_004151, partial [Flavobacteriales bacterium]